MYQQTDQNKLETCVDHLAVCASFTMNISQHQDKNRIHDKNLVYTVLVWMDIFSVHKLSLPSFFGPNHQKR